jgi:hypothetical protein
LEEQPWKEADAELQYCKCLFRFVDFIDEEAEVQRKK